MLLGELTGAPDPDRSNKVTHAMLKMHETPVAGLQTAYDS